MSFKEGDRVWVCVEGVGPVKATITGPIVGDDVYDVVLDEAIDGLTFFQAFDAEDEIRLMSIVDEIAEIKP